MTYQRNMGLSSEDPLNDGVPDRVEEPEIGPGDDHEPERHGRALANLAAVRPLDAAQLLPGGAQEVRRAAEEALARRGRRRLVAFAVGVFAARGTRGRARRGTGFGEVGLG